MDIKELLVTLNMLNIEYINQGNDVYINSNCLYADEELEITLKKLIIKNGYKYEYFQWDSNSIELFCIHKE